MLDYNNTNNDEKMFMVESTIKNGLGDRDEIRLYEELSLALELMEDNSFEVIGGEINNGINFEITTNFPHPLPEKIGIMFFNIDFRFYVGIKETSKFVYSRKRHFSITIKRN